MIEHYSEQSRARALRGRPLTILERVLDGESQKVIAADLGVSTSSVSTDLRLVSRKLGLSDRGSIHVLLAELRCAARFESTIAATVCRVPPCWLVVEVPRAERLLSHSLSPAELEVCGLYLEGLSHAQISRQRKRSERTIANQLASVFKRLRVSGRVELLVSVAKKNISVKTPPHAGGIEPGVVL